MRFLVRFLSLIFLVIAVIAGVVDAIQSVAAGKPDLTRLGGAWRDLSPDTLGASEAVVRPYVWEPAVDWVLAQPTVAVFLALSLAFYLVGYRRRKPAGRFAA